jgi:FkbM family methyltransferase
LKLENKYEVASVQDVFCDPFYWQVFNYLNSNTSPNLIVDCGAHCGHFSILADICIRKKFQTSNAEYLLIEPNPGLYPILQKNLEDAKIASRSNIILGLVGGKKEGYDTLWVHPKNYLTSSLSEIKGAKPHKINYIDLLEVIKDRTIDLMKIDIEGSEYEFIENNHALLLKTNLIFMELHQDTALKEIKLIKAIESAGLCLTGLPLETNGNKFLIFKR